MIKSLPKKLGIYEKNKFEQKPIKTGRKFASVGTTQQICGFWRNSSVTSKNTLCPVKITVCDKLKIQINLAFVDSVNIIE